MTDTSNQCAHMLPMVELDNHNTLVQFSYNSTSMEMGVCPSCLLQAITEALWHDWYQKTGEMPEKGFDGVVCSQHGVASDGTPLAQRHGYHRVELKPIHDDAP